MGDFNFVKTFICALNGWNPYSDEVMKLPYSYWLIAFRTHSYKLHEQWEELVLPQAEIITSITAPENFEEYRKWKKTEAAKKKDESVEVKVDGVTTAVANAFYDPEVGLVDKDGKLLITTTEFEKRNNLEGILVSY